jgi:hypothetical protein
MPAFVQRYITVGASNFTTPIEIWPRLLTTGPIMVPQVSVTLEAN